MLGGDAGVAFHAALQLGYDAVAAFHEAAAALLVVRPQVAHSRVVPAQPSVFPAHIQPQHGAPAVVHPRRVPDNHNRHIAPVFPPPPNQAGGVAPPPVRVKQPVFGDAESGVVQQLDDFVVARRVVGCHFQHKIGRLALLADGVALLLNNPGAEDAEGDEQVGYPHAGAAAGHFPGDGDFAQHYGGFGVAQVQAQGGLVAGVVEMGSVHHIAAGRIVGEPGRPGRVRRRVRPPGQCCRR